MKNSMKILRVVAYSPSIGLMLLFFQNCSPGFKSNFASQTLSSQSSLNSNTQGETEIEDPPSDPNPVEVLSGKALYDKNCLACHNAISTWGERAAKVDYVTIASAIANVDKMTFLKGKLTPQEMELISMAIIASAPVKLVVSPQGKSARYQCDPKIQPKSRMLKLTNREYAAALNMILEEFNVSISSDTQLNALVGELPRDLVSGHFSDVEDQSLQDAVLFNKLFDISFRAGQLVSTSPNLSNYPNTDRCLGATQITQGCHERFVGELASKAFRRTLSPQERANLVSSTWNSSLSKADLLLETFTTIISYPDFIYKAYDKGAFIAGETGTSQISDLEFAHKIAFFITGKPADATLRRLANSGQLRTDSAILAQVDRLLATSDGRSTLQRFFRETYGYDKIGKLSYVAAYLEGLNLDNIQSAATAELDHFFLNTTLDQRGKVGDLFTSRTSIPNHDALATIYKTARSSTSVQLPPERAGFLSRFSLLTKKDGFLTSPVQRGIYVLENILCQSVGEPPANAPTALDPVEVATQNITTRDRYYNLTQKSNTTCLSCHSTINPYGFVLEEFDSLGRFRRMENIFDQKNNRIKVSLPINTKANLMISSQKKNELILNSSQMNEELANSDFVRLCFAKHLRRFDKRVRVDQADNCIINSIANEVDTQNPSGEGSILQAIKTYIILPEFRKWRN